MVRDRVGLVRPLSDTPPRTGKRPRPPKDDPSRIKRSRPGVTSMPASYNPSSLAGRTQDATVCERPAPHVRPLAQGEGLTVASAMGISVASAMRPTQSRGSAQSIMPASPKSTAPDGRSVSLGSPIVHHSEPSEDSDSTLDAGRTETTFPAPSRSACEAAGQQASPTRRARRAPLASTRHLYRPCLDGTEGRRVRPRLDGSDTRTEATHSHTSTERPLSSIPVERRRRSTTRPAAPAAAALSPPLASVGLSSSSLRPTGSPRGCSELEPSDDERATVVQSQTDFKSMFEFVCSLFPEARGSQPPRLAPSLLVHPTYYSRSRRLGLLGHNPCSSPRTGPPTHSVRLRIRLSLRFYGTRDTGCYVPTPSVVMRMQAGLLGLTLTWHQLSLSGVENHAPPSLRPT